MATRAGRFLPARERARVPYYPGNRSRRPVRNVG